MAITNFIPQIWSARLTHNLGRISVFLPNTNREYEGDASMGNTVKVFTLNRDSTTVKDYNRNQDIDAPQTLETTTQDVVINQEKYFSFAVDDLDAVQARSGLVDQATTDAVDKIGLTIDGFVAGLLDAVQDNAFGFRSPDIQVAATSSLKPLDFTSDAKTRATKLGLSRNNLVCITTPEVIRNFDKDFLRGQYGGELQSTVAVGEGAMGDASDANGFVGVFNGIRFYVTNDTNLVSGTGSSLRHKAWIYDPRDLALIVQVNRVEAFRPERRFADAVKGLVNYGGKVLNASRMQEFTFQGTTLT